MLVRSVLSLYLASYPIFDHLICKSLHYHLPYKAYFLPEQLSLHSRSAGRTNVAVTFSCDFVSPSYSQSRLYDASLSLSVVPALPLALGVPITWVLPPHYVTSSLLPSSLESHGQWDGQGQSRKGTITYSLLRSCEKNEFGLKDAISIDGGRIKTIESNNLACIQAKDRTIGRIEIASCIRVAEVLILFFQHYYF